MAGRDDFALPSTDDGLLVTGEYIVKRSHSAVSLTSTRKAPTYASLLICPQGSHDPATPIIPAELAGHMPCDTRMLVMV